MSFELNRVKNKPSYEEINFEDEEDENVLVK
jgi:hypothetical protein